ncbi:DUF3892 domain-containing protein [Myxococcus sp. K15C18031901]|uniref:DUF3892 domain-containing protein n=1 Tax=Myxococcus dinghuensis TaxID=2906761 RepID=UPI0020A7DD02|nr:DUF3892 domain-containing protein [Myxococcus dinghuensis]MCP3098436.1 DUF3892 domain-containing protein [Myxococcus dinghuensis]
MLYITHIHLEGGERLEHITSVHWTNGAKTDTSTREAMVRWIDEGGEAWVKAPTGDVRVLVVRATPPYLRSEANNRLTDNLLALPRF